MTTWVLVMTIMSTWHKPNVSVNTLRFETKSACEQAHTEALRQLSYIHETTDSKFVYTGKCLPITGGDDYASNPDVGGARRNQ